MGFFKHELEISFYLEWQTSTTSHLSVSFPKTSLTLCWKSKSAAAEMLLARDRGPYWLLFSWVCPGWWDRFNSAPVQLGPDPTRVRSHPTGKRPTGTEYSPLSADLSKTITNTNENTTTNTNTNTNTNDNTNTNTEPTLSPRQLCPSKYIKPYHIYMHLSSILIDSFTAKLLDFSKTSLFEINCDFENRFW